MFRTAKLLRFPRFQNFILAVTVINKGFAHIINICISTKYLYTGTSVDQHVFIIVLKAIN